MHPEKLRENLVRVWLTEDNDTLRAALKRLCTKRYKLDCAHAFSNAEDMIETMKASSSEELPEVLLLDVGLPGRSGLEAMEDIIQLAPDCRIVILTIFEDEKKIARAIRAGASGYLLKTAVPEDIVAAIHEVADGGAPMSPTVAARVVKLLAKLTQPTKNVSLSPREQEILALIVDGRTGKEIAQQINVSIHTVDSHTRQIFKKLNVRSRAAAVACALRDKLV
ncbi:MAG: response regulator [Akkermansiaceae bacterium]